MNKSVQYLLDDIDNKTEELLAQTEKFTEDAEPGYAELIEINNKLFKKFANCRRDEIMRGMFKLQDSQEALSEFYIHAAEHLKVEHYHIRMSAYRRDMQKIIDLCNALEGH